MAIEFIYGQSPLSLPSCSTESEAELELSTDSEAELEPSTDSAAELELSTDSEAELEFSTESEERCRARLVAINQSHLQCNT